jgi:hypothetical protein
MQLINFYRIEFLEHVLSNLRNILNAFLDEEFVKARIDFQLFLTVFKKWYFSCQNTALDTESQVNYRLFLILILDQNFFFKRFT